MLSIKFEDFKVNESGVYSWDWDRGVNFSVWKSGGTWTGQARLRQGRKLNLATDPEIKVLRGMPTKEIAIYELMIAVKVWFKTMARAISPYIVSLEQDEPELTVWQ